MTATTSHTSEPNPLIIDVWSDISCPYCYMGYVTLDRAIEKFPHDAPIIVRTRSFILHPDLTDTPTMTPDDIVVAETGWSTAQASKSNAALIARGAELGLELNFDRVQVVSTNAAHELTHFAAEHKLQHEMVMRLFRAYFTEGVNVADHHELARLGVEIGLDEADVVRTLDERSYADAIDADRAEARHHGITGTPYFLFPGEIGLSGSQGIGNFMNALSMSRASASSQG